MMEQAKRHTDKRQRILISLYLGSDKLHSLYTKRFLENVFNVPTQFLHDFIIVYIDVLGNRGK